MKTIVLTNNSTPIMVDPETLEVNGLETQREAIRSIYKIDEDCTIKQGDNTVEAKKGDLLITFWESDFSKKFIIVTCEEWYNMLTEYNELMQKQKEEWAKNKENNQAAIDLPQCDNCEAAQN